MQELKQLLDDKLGWLVNTTGAKHVSVKLDASQLARIMNALREAENKSPDLPRIEPRLLLTDEDIERQYEDGICLGAGLPRETCPCGFCQKYREPRLLHPQEPRGTKRSPEEVAKILAESYGQNRMHQSRKRLHTCA